MQEKSVREVTFAGRLRVLMEERGLNASQLARKVGVSHVAIGNLLKNDMPRSELLFAIACELGVSMDYFFGRDRSPTQWSPGDSVSDKPTLDEVEAARSHTTIAANALRTAEQTGRLKAVKGRVEALEEQARQLRQLLDEMIGTAADQAPRPPSSPVRYSDPVSSTRGTDTAAHARLVGERPEPRPPASRGRARTTGGPTASVPAPAAPPHPPGDQ